ncbi:MATE family efflux transporter [Haloglycomyces albus]|uniref:MATE family efflux transporter n=1 Tax=Haloglycomyces albus TaxID=526067 RepID=UPI00046CDED9|nr:MATE family efflux transporter [Haloglycomyces albus]
MDERSATGDGSRCDHPDESTSAVSVRRIISLSAPALVVLAAEPIYMLIDTAVVGHLGAVPLAALALGTTVMGLAAWIGTILAYGTTSRAARRFGAGDREGAVGEGVQGTWLALAAGSALIVATQLFAGPLAQTLGDDPQVAAEAELWLRTAVFGAPFLLVTAAGQGWMRALQDTRRPMYFVCLGFVIAAILTPTLVYPVGMGLLGSAVANVVAQIIAGCLFLRAITREGVSLRPHVTLIRKQLTANRDLLVRGAAMQACFISAAAVAARIGATALAAHQIGIQLWFAIALALDAVAIAAQALIGADLGAGLVDRAKATARRLTWMGLGYGVVFLFALLVAVSFLGSVFTSDEQVREQLNHVWWWMVLLMPVAGVVYALDGVLIGAGDLRFMRNMNVTAAVSWLPFTWLTLTFGWGLSGIWAGLSCFMCVRLVFILWRMYQGTWSVVGIEREPA